MDNLPHTVGSPCKPDGRTARPAASVPGAALELTDITDQASTLADFDAHDKVLRVTDPTSGLHAIIALHDSTLGPALGGCRMWRYADEGAAITDALRLSRGMTYKAAMAGVAAGGGKSVIIGDPRADKSEALFRAFGRAVNALGGTYYSGEDVGVSVQDMSWAAAETPYIFGSADRGGDPSPMTAYGVHVGIKAAVRHRLRRDDLAGLRVSVQGLGHVGNELCRLLAEDGAKLVVTDVDADAMLLVVLDYGATAVEPHEIYDIEADVFAPCALGGVINDKTLAKLHCAVVAGSANNQLAEDRHGAALRDNHVLYAPDYVVNAGGLIAFSLVLGGGAYDEARAREITAGIGGTLHEIFERADAEGAPTSAVADRIARERVRRGGTRSD